MESKFVKQLRRLRNTTRRRGLYADLSVRDWVTTCEDFQGKCAYCGKNAGRTVDHFIPMVRGGMTTIDNCLPSCSHCNNLKGGFPPELFFSVPMERIEHLRLYLLRRGKGQRGWPDTPLVQDRKIEEIAPLQTMKGTTMSTQELHSTKKTLPGGKEVTLYSNETQIVLQLRQVTSEGDLLSPSFQVAVPLTAAESVALAMELLRVASPQLEKAQALASTSLSLGEPEDAYWNTKKKI